MADPTRPNAWRRFLAAPNDSRGKTVAVAFLVAAICALFVSGATVILRPIQQANRAAEQQIRLEALLAAIPGMDDILAEAGDGELSTVVIDLEAGRAVEMTPEELEVALNDPGNWTSLTQEQDMAGIGTRQNYAQVYLLRDSNDDVSLLILPVYGAGAQGPIHAMLALHGDMRTIAGMTVLEHVETPGLGGRIDEPAWQQSFAGVRWADDAGNMQFSVARGPSASDFEVDGITGATRTSDAIERIVRFWLGPDGFGPLVAAIKRGEF